MPSNATVAVVCKIAASGSAIVPQRLRRDEVQRAHSWCAQRQGKGWLAACTVGKGERHTDFPLDSVRFSKESSCLVTAVHKSYASGTVTCAQVAISGACWKVSRGCNSTICAILRWQVGRFVVSGSTVLGMEQHNDGEYLTGIVARGSAGSAAALCPGARAAEKCEWGGL
eukprot:5934579-Amphidinium_carterae.1